MEKANPPGNIYESEHIEEIQSDKSKLYGSTTSPDSQLDSAIFSEIFYCQGKKEFKEHLILFTSNSIAVYDHPDMNISIQDIIGASVSQISLSDRSQLDCEGLPAHLFSLTLHMYPKVTKKHLFGPKTSTRQSYDILYYIESEKIANDWKNLIIQSTNNPTFLQQIHQYRTIDEIPVFKRLLLVFINPHSGKKLAPARWAMAKQFLTRSGCEFVEVVTEYSGHARYYITSQTLEELLIFDGIVTVSGDGLPHEIINGLCSRPDWEQLKHIPLGPLPGGSGNALVKNLLTRAEEELGLYNACYLIAKGKSTYSDLMAIELSGRGTVYSFLSFVWAAMARVDIESEAIRWLGALRFHMYGVLSILEMKKYRAKIIYSEERMDLPSLDEEIAGNEWVKSEEDFTYFCVYKMPYITESDLAAPITDFQDGQSHMIALKGEGNTREKMTKILFGFGNGLFGNEERIREAGIFYKKVKSFRLESIEIPGNYYSIDGEKYESSKAQGYVKEKALRFFCTK